MVLTYFFFSFFTIAMGLTAKTAKDAYFLSRFEKSILPLMFLAVAIAIAPILGGYTKLAKKLAPKVMFFPHTLNACFWHDASLSQTDTKQHLNVANANRNDCARGRGAQKVRYREEKCHTFYFRKMLHFLHVFSLILNVRSVYHPVLPQLFLNNIFWRRFSASGRSRDIFYFTFWFVAAHMVALSDRWPQKFPGGLKNRVPGSGLTEIPSRQLPGTLPTSRLIYREGSEPKWTKARRLGHLTRPRTLFAEGAKCWISCAKIERDVVDFSLASLTSIEFQEKETSES